MPGKTFRFRAEVPADRINCLNHRFTADPRLVWRRPWIAANTAAQKIAKVLFDAVTQSFRQHKVDSIVENTDGAVQDLTGALNEIILTDKDCA